MAAIVGAMKKALLPLVGALSLALLSACSGGPAAAVIPPQSERPASQPAQSPTQEPTAPESAVPTDSATPDPAESPELPNTDPTPLPTDCRTILTPEVLAQLDGVALNHESYGPAAGPQPDGSITCIWGDPADESRTLVTRIAKHTPHEASVILGDARNAGLECTELDIAVRCSGEQTVDGTTDPVGRTLFVRGGIVIDTQFINLAPEGYTNAIIQAIWPEGSE